MPLTSMRPTIRYMERGGGVGGEGGEGAIDLHETYYQVQGERGRGRGRGGGGGEGGEGAIDPLETYYQVQGIARQACDRR